MNEKMLDLISKLKEASVFYYKYDNPILSDREYDNLYNELEVLEKQTSIIMNDSPTQKVQGEILPELKKVIHSTPMLSADKTKSLDDLETFLGDKEGVLSWKLDGLTIVLKYQEGKLIQAITRGSGGEIGEDVTHTIRTCRKLPLHIPHREYLEIRGECFISYETFKEINNLNPGKYKNPRNLASGTVRQLDSNIARERSLEFKAFAIVKSNNSFKTKSEQFKFLMSLGIPVVEHRLVSSSKEIADVMKDFDPIKYENPVDGLILEYNDLDYGKSLGVTTHHPLNIMAFKWKDGVVETILTDMEWSASRTGLLNPVAIFEPVEIEGTTVSRASLHNVSIFNNLKLGVGDKIEVYKANMIIPQIYQNLTQSGSLKVPDKCPVCGGKTEILMENDSAQLYCKNIDCTSKIIRRLQHFCDKKSLDISGVSEATLQTLVNKKIIKNYIDILSLPEKEEDLSTIEKLPGFGKKSVENLVSSINKARTALPLNRFIRALGIPNIGSSTAKDIAEHCQGNWELFQSKMDTKYDWQVIPDFGEVMSDSLKKYWDQNRYEVLKMLKYITFAKREAVNASNTLNGKSICVTGKLYQFANREELALKIESLGGKVVSGVTKKTNFLLTNDTGSGSSKNKKAVELNIPIISEIKFIKMIEGEIK